MAIGKGSVNRVTLVGNLGADPELKQTNNGTSVITLTLATNEIRKNRDGEKHDQTEWHRVIFWRRLAEIAAEHLKKGSKIFVEGSLRTRTWEDAESNKRTVTEILGEKLTMLDSKNAAAESAIAADTDVPVDENES